jgi:hypothetical protein
MPTQPLPDRPDLEHLRNRARDLQRAAAGGDAEALALFTEHHPDGVPSDVTLTAAQLTVARHHGFATWATLKHHVETVKRLTRAPDTVGTADDPVHEFLRLACLTYGDADHPDRWAGARQVLDAHPDLPARSLHVAAAVGDADAVRTHLGNGAGANDDGGPFAWPPLLYLTYARHDPAPAGAAVTSTLRALLDAGADPDAGFLWHGYASPFTALTGAFGEGEQGAERQPRHPHAQLVARALLEAGADPNDGQALYNRIFRPDDDHLELLFAFGLGKGDGGPWHRRLGDAIDSPQQIVRGQLHWAVTHGFHARVELLAANGVDIGSPFTDLRQTYWHDARTPVQLAGLNGHPAIAARLVELGAAPADLDPTDAMVAALLSGDRSRVDALEQTDPGRLAAVRAARPGLIVWAAARRGHDIVSQLLDLGFDVNAKGRGDVPIEEPWQTALHEAANRNDAALAGVLLAAGADPNIRDARFDAPPLGWAQHAGSAELIELLEPLTTAAPS